MNIQKRKKFVASAFLCSNCLRFGHDNSTCQSSACRICAQKHHTLLHEDKEQRNHTNKLDQANENHSTT